MSELNIDGRHMPAWKVIGREGAKFCDFGDSGSWVIDRNGRWVGLLFVCCQPNESSTGDGYVISATEVIKDIKTVARGVVSLQ
jgi:hypothetical protein